MHPTTHFPLTVSSLSIASGLISSPDTMLIALSALVVVLLFVAGWLYRQNIRLQREVTALKLQEGGEEAGLPQLSRPVVANLASSEPSSNRELFSAIVYALTMRQTFFGLLIIAVAAIASSYEDAHGPSAGSGELLPDSPRYDDASQWYVTDRHGLADIFYVISTETGDYPVTGGNLCHYADTYADSLRHPMCGEMAGVDTLLSGALNFFSPYYRQCSLQSFVSDSLAAQRITLPTSDVRRAFAHYLTHYNQHRPFILAGFSQGAVIALQLLSEMDDDVYSRMVAAYIIGASIPQSMADTCRRIRPAQRADDVGVTVCYNSVSHRSAALWSRSAWAINPVNWHTDEQPATFVTVPSPLLPAGQQRPDTLTVHLDTATNLLVVQGYRADDYVLPFIGREGNYHSREIWLYRDHLRQNMQLRVQSMP